MLVLQDRKEEILSELGDIVGSSAANAIGDMACQQAATVEKFSGTGMDMEAEQLQNRCCVKSSCHISTCLLLSTVIHYYAWLSIGSVQFTQHTADRVRETQLTYFRRPSISEHPPQQHHQMQPKLPQQPQDQPNNGELGT